MGAAKMTAIKWLHFTVSYGEGGYLARCTQRYKLGREPYFGCQYVVVIEKGGHILDTSHVSDSNLKKLITNKEAVTAMRDYRRSHD